MADFPGTFLFQTHQGPSTTNPDFGNLVEPDYLLSWMHTWPLFGPKTNTQPVEELQEARAGDHIRMFAFLDFYNRIHVTPLRLDLGNIVSTQERDISVWNAYFVPHTLNAITIQDGDGMTLSQPIAAPVVYGPLQEIIYTLSVSTEGPPTVEAVITFDFDIIDIPVPVTGVRIVAWMWEANWENPVVEKPAWNTDVIESDNASEQRRQLREFPRVTWEFLYDIQDAERRLFENVIYAWGGRIWALPIMADIQVLTVDALDGQEEIPAETAGFDFHVDGLAILIGTSGYESIEIATVTPTAITIHRPLANNWPAGTRLYPARAARLQEPRSFQRFHRNHIRGVAVFLSEEEIEHEELTETLYRGYPVMEIDPNWRDAPDINYARKMAIRSFGTGQDDVQDQGEIALPLHAWRWTALSRDDCNTMKKWLWTRRGRQKAIWVPTFSDDLELISVIAPSASVMVVTACGLVHFAQANIHRRDVRIKLKDGRFFYRRISSFVTVDATSERVSLNAVLGEEVRPDDVESISWLHLLRLDTDEPEIAWLTAGVAELAVVMKGPRNDV